jgi:hypothetical protein
MIQGNRILSGPEEILLLRILVVDWERAMVCTIAHTLWALRLQSQPYLFNSFLEGEDPSVSARVNPDVRVHPTLSVMRGLESHRLSMKMLGRAHSFNFLERSGKL